MSEEKKLLSKRQLLTLRDFGKRGLCIDYGPFGCGKSFAKVMALGLWCMSFNPPKTNSYITFVGKTLATVKSNICNDLSTFFGDNFRYDSSKKDGYTKDAVLFGHRIRFIGLNDKTAEERIRGLNTYGIYLSEVSVISEDNLLKLIGRLRGEKPKGSEYWLEGDTNPDSPIHYLKKMLDDFLVGKGNVKFVKWNEFDRITPDAKAYYENLRVMYRDNPAYLARYVLGEWAAADGLVYSCFREKEHTLTPEQIKQLDFVEYRMGIDFGLNNPTAYITVNLYVDGVKRGTITKTPKVGGGTDTWEFSNFSDWIASNTMPYWATIEATVDTNLPALVIPPYGFIIRVDTKTRPTDIKPLVTKMYLEARTHLKIGSILTMNLVDTAVPTLDITTLNTNVHIGSIITMQLVDEPVPPDITKMNTDIKIGSLLAMQLKEEPVPPNIKELNTLLYMGSITQLQLIEGTIPLDLSSIKSSANVGSITQFQLVDAPQPLTLNTLKSLTKVGSITQFKIN